MAAVRDAPQFRERVTPWSTRVPGAYVVCAIMCRRGGHDGRS
eukprot:COSAG01_NODE_6017_length_3899_cov_21.556842_4_plen_42_part_00